MSKLRGGIFSLGASGRLGPDIVLTRHGQATIARKYKPPLDAQSVTQLLRRDWFSQCVAAWHQLTPAQKEEYRLVNPSIGTNAAYLNFMREWLHMAVPVHAPTHTHDQGDPVSVEDLESSQVGISDAPLLNFVKILFPLTVFNFINASSVGLTWWDIRAQTSPTAVYAFLGLRFLDTGSAGAETWLVVRGLEAGTDTMAYGPHINNTPIYAWGFVPLTDLQRFLYHIQASGVGTAHARTMITGYLEPAEG